MRAKLRGLRAAGINRISFGVQSFHAGPPEDRSGRIHSAARRDRRDRAARAAGFANLNLDLIFAVPGQTLRRVGGRPGDRGGARARPHLGLRPDLRGGHRLRRPAAQRRADAAAGGGRGGDVHPHARRARARTATRRTRSRTSRAPGRACAHNLNYWRAGAYLGVGAGAHSFAAPAGAGPALGRTRRARRATSSAPAATATRAPARRR